MTNIIKMAILKFVPIVILSLISMAIPAAGETVTLDLNTAINLALENDEIYLIARKELDRADGQIMEAVSGALPQVTGGLNYLRSWAVPTGIFQMKDEIITFKFGVENTYTADLTLTQPIYSGGRTFTALKMARVYKKMANELVRQSRQDLNVRVFNGFYGVLLAREIHRVNEGSYALAQENLDVTRKMFDQGMVAEYDLLQARVALANLEPMVIRSRSEAEVAENALKNILGLDIDTELILNAELDSSLFALPPIDINEAKIRLRENRPEVRIGRYETRLNEYMVSIARAGYRPSLAFSTSLQYQAQFSHGNVFDKKWYRSLTSAVFLSVPIFDSWRTSSRVKQAKVDMIQSRLKEESVTKNMILDFERNLGSYNEARQRLSAQGNAVELARRGLNIANVRYESGVGIQLEVSDARLALARAEINNALAFHDLAVSYAALMRSLGREIETFK